MKRKLGAVLLLIAGLSLLATQQVVFAQGSTQTYQAQLAPANGSGASGTATVTVNGNQLTVNITSQGLSPNLPHAQHIHIGGQHVCPTPAADKNGDGYVSTPEAQPYAGPVKVSLTTSGDVSAKSGVAVSRMPLATPSGTLSYSRTFTLPQGVSPSDIADGVVEQHGIDLNHDGKYDGAKKSEVPGAPPGTPFEATVPADCGKLVATTMPSTGGPNLTPWVMAGGALLVGSGLVVGIGGRLRNRR